MARFTRFTGGGRHKVDAKGRVSIPADFRRVIQDCDPHYTEGLRPRFYIFYGDHRRAYLECFSVEAMDEVDRKIENHPDSDTREFLEWVYHGHSVATEVDPDGRIVLSQMLRDRIGLNGEAQFMGAGRKFQIWPPEACEQEDLQMQERLDSMPAGMSLNQVLDGGTLGGAET